MYTKNPRLRICRNASWTHTHQAGRHEACSLPATAPSFGPMSYNELQCSCWRKIVARERLTAEWVTVARQQPPRCLQSSPQHDTQEQYSSSLHGTPCIPSLGWDYEARTAALDAPKREALTATFAQRRAENAGHAQMPLVGSLGD
jgi:hypothetical protein